MANRNTGREQQQRVAAYTARLRVHRDGVRRRNRDNWLAATIGGAIVVLSVAGQVVYATVGPGAPTAEPTASTQPAASAPDPALANNARWKGRLVINENIELGITLFGDLAPQATSSFISLAQQGYFDGTVCHRLTTSETAKVLQCGDPTATAEAPELGGTGGPGYQFGPIENAPSNQVYETGVIAMARPADVADGMGSQFFIVYGDSTFPDDSVGGYSVFGEVTRGLDTLVKKIADAGVKPVTDGATWTETDGPPAETATITSITLEQARSEGADE